MWCFRAHFEKVHSTYTGKFEVVLSAPAVPLATPAPTTAPTLEPEPVTSPTKAPISAPAPSPAPAPANPVAPSKRESSRSEPPQAGSLGTVDEPPMVPVGRKTREAPRSAGEAQVAIGFLYPCVTHLLPQACGHVGCDYSSESRRDLARHRRDTGHSKVGISTILLADFPVACIVSYLFLIHLILTS